MEPGGPRSRRPFRKPPRPADTASSTATLMSTWKASAGALPSKRSALAWLARAARSKLAPWRSAPLLLSGSRPRWLRCSA
eukprot:13527875-Alexandrium_andersonii.AAC.1